MQPLVLVIAVVVGVFIGAAGVGGILIVPPLAFLGGLDIHEASATALFTFIFTGLYGTWLFHRRGTIAWRMAWPVCAGAAVFSYVGAWVNLHVSGTAVSVVIAAVTAFAAAYLLWPATSRSSAAWEGHPSRQAWVLAGVGVVAGFGSGLSGAGGPLFSVPMMMVLGFPALAAIGVGQVLQIVAATFGSVAHLRAGTIQWDWAPWLAAAELVGVYAGVHVAHRAKALHLRGLVAILCIVVAAWVLVKTF